AGLDYQAASGTVTFAAGQRSRTITVNVLGDAIHEADETFLVNLSNPAGATLAVNQATGTILDDDPASSPPVLQFDGPTASVAEGAGQAVLTVTRNGDTSGTVTVGYATSDGTAHAGADYRATSGSLTFGPGQMTQTITIDLIDDALVEGDETLRV